MKSGTKNKEHRWKDSISSLPTSSRSSSILSDSSDGHFEIRNFPLPKPSLSASEAQKQRESHQAYNSSKLVGLPGYDPNRIPLSIFSSKPGNSKDWSITSNESLFSIHDEKFSALATTLRFDEIPRLDEAKTEINPIEKPNESEKETKSDSEIDENEEDMFELESDNDEEEDEGISEEESLIEIETEISEEKQETETMKENKPEDSNSMVSHSHATSCLTDVSNNSTASFTLPELQKEDGVIKTPSMLIKRNVMNQMTQRSIIRRKLQHQPYAKSSTLTKVQSQSKPQRKASKKHLESQSQSPKDKSNGWFSCFHCPSMSGLFK